MEKGSWKNVIFLDFDGVINTCKDNSKEATEKRIRILGEICKRYDCKVVIEASVKSFIDEETLETDVEWVNEIYKLFEKYGIDCIGRTPEVSKKINEFSEIPIWKEDEILLYLSRHPSIENYVVIDDDDLPKHSDLDKVRDHLVTPLMYAENKEDEGLQEFHIEEVGKILKKQKKKL